MSTATQTKTCCRCGEQRPIEEFRRKRRDDLSRRESACNDCHRRDMRRWRQEQRQKAFRRFCRRAPNQTLDRRFRALLAAALERLGGVEELAGLLAAQAKALHAARAGDTTPVRAVMTLIRLAEYVDVHQGADEAVERTDFGGLTDEELKARTRDSIVSLIGQEPQIAVAAAQTLGWTVIPPQGL